MFALILYCGLISSVVSAHFNNDTTHDRDELDVNSTLSTLGATTIPVSKDCVLEMKENEISQIVELLNSAIVNVVVIHISFSNRTDNRQLFSDFHVSLSNPIGQEILHALERWEFKFLTWTLRAGIKSFVLNVKGSHNDCVEREKNATDFVLESTQHIVDSINLATNYEVCSSFKETLSGKIDRTCCQITKPSLATKFDQHKCSKGSSFLFKSDLPWVVIYMIMFYFSHFYLTWLLLVFLSRTGFDLKYPKYYELGRSPMSPSSILRKIIWEKNGRVVSFIRSFVLVGVFSYVCYLWPRRAYFLHVIVVFVLWGASFLVANLVRSKITDSSVILDRIRAHHSSVKRGEIWIVVKMLTLSFNLKVWGQYIKDLYKYVYKYKGRVTRRFSNRILKTLALCAYSVLAVLICFLFVCILFLAFITAAGVFPLFCLVSLLVLITSLQIKLLKPYLGAALGVGLSFFVIFSSNMVILTTLSFLLGLFLNLIYFIPYMAFFSVLTFYCYSFWKTMEEKYFVLKRLIYEACQETQMINNGCIPNRHPKPSEKVLAVVSKEPYSKIREEFLPYDTNLFYLGLKIFWSIAFSFVIFTLINMLNAFNVTGLVQVVTTASLGIMPHILNITALRDSEERKKAWNEDLKLNVKYMVEELIREDPELARTVLTIEQDDDVIKENIIAFFNTTADDENTEDSEHVGTMFGTSFSDNDDVKDIEPVRTVTVRRDVGTTTDGNFQNSENVHARFESNPDNDDVEDNEPAPIVVIHRNHKTNDENAENCKTFHVPCRLEC